MRYVKDFFCYSAEPFVLPPESAIEERITIRADAAFEWDHTTATAIMDDDISREIIYALPIELMIIDGGSGRQLLDMPVRLANLCKMRNPGPRMFLPRSTIALRFKNPWAVLFSQIHFVMHGWKVFDLEPGA